MHTVIRNQSPLRSFLQGVATGVDNLGGNAKTMKAVGAIYLAAAVSVEYFGAGTYTTLFSVVLTVLGGTSLLAVDALEQYQVHKALARLAP